MSTRHCDTCVSLLYVEGCPSYKRVWEDLLDVIARSGVAACVRPVVVTTADQAQEMGFLGSPSVRVNGVDLEGIEGGGTLSCRVYSENDGRNWPSKELLWRSLVAPSTATI